MGSKGQNFTFSENSDNSYQIKENRKCSNTVANILPNDPLLSPSPPHPRTMGMGSVGQNSTFKEHCVVAYEIKTAKYAATWLPVSKFILPPGHLAPHPPGGGGGGGQAVQAGLSCPPPPPPNTSKKNIHVICYFSVSF